MEEIQLTPTELKDIIDNNKQIGEGHFGTVIDYGDRLLKIDKNLYKALKNKKLYNVDYEVNKYYEYDKRDFQDRNQIEELAKKQKDITLTQLPKGIITFKNSSFGVNNISPGIIIHHHKDCDKLENLNPKDCKKVLIILKKLLLAVKELEENKISQEDLIQYIDYDIDKRSINVLYKDITPQIIDMSGFYVKVGNKYINAENMYRDLSDIILDYFYFNGLKFPIARGKVTNYQDSCDMIKEFEERKK